MSKHIIASIGLDADTLAGSLPSENALTTHFPTFRLNRHDPLTVRTGAAFRMRQNAQQELRQAEIQYQRRRAPAQGPRTRRGAQESRWQAVSATQRPRALARGSASGGTGRT